jgi:N-acyl homoserine lactone hydrolase
VAHSVQRLAAAIVVLSFAASAAAQRCPADGPAASPRLYVLDGGVLASDPSRYHLTDADVETTALSVAAYLIVHPRGVLLWDAGAVPDAERVSAESGAEQHLVLADGQDRYVTLGAPLLAQLAAIGCAPGDIDYLALSHYHWDHTANADAFAAAHWLARRKDWEAMFAPEPAGSVRPATYAALRNSETTLLDDEEYDVFGDGSVLLESAPGHTPGHQVLYVKLDRTGPVVLSGDLYHYAAERRLGRLPTFEFDTEQTAASREAIEAFLARTGAALWIQHDLTAHRKFKKAPEYYD